MSEHRIALGRDIQEWLVRGMEHVALQTPPPTTLEMQAFLTLLRAAKLVTILVDDADVPARDDHTN